MKKMTKKEQDLINAILNAKPAQEPDRAQIKWKKRQWKLPRGKTTTRLRVNRPAPAVYWNILRNSGRKMTECELCGSDYKLNIHHKNGNPNNNALDNLQILCQHCHFLYHDPTEEGVHDELEGTKNDTDNLDDPEVRKFYGIVQEEDVPNVDDDYELSEDEECSASLSFRFTCPGPKFRRKMD